MSGTKRLAVLGPWHGQVIEPDSDAYEHIRCEPPKRIVLPGETAPGPSEPLLYVPAAIPVPVAQGVALAPVLVPEGVEITMPELLDALILAVYGTPAEGGS